MQIRYYSSLGVVVGKTMPLQDGLTVAKALVFIIDTNLMLDSHVKYAAGLARKAKVVGPVDVRIEDLKNRSEVNKERRKDVA